MTRAFLLLSLLLLLLLNVVSASDDLSTTTQPPVVFLPGFASTQLHSWGYYNCPNSPVDVYVGDRIWLSTSKVLAVDPFRTSCWLRCMMLHV
jgi:hypothetical protein